MRIERKQLADGHSIDIPRPESYRDCMALIRSDYYRSTGQTAPARKLVGQALRHPLGAVLFWFRLCQYRGRFFRLFCHIYGAACRRANIYLPPLTRVGYGLSLGHGMCLVVNGGTIIGNNVNLSHFVSIGTNDDKPAIIGDNVYVGPNVSIVEDVSIGCNVTIGAGAVVTRSLPPDATAVGCPAKPIHTQSPARYITNPYRP